MPHYLEQTTNSVYANLAECSFPVKRVYWIYNVPNGEIRGTHAHRTCQEYLVLITGRIYITLKDQLGRKKRRVLSRPGAGLYIDPMVWKMIKFSSNARLLVLASEAYDPTDYIYKDEFEQLCTSPV